jgi:hypothetical protein
MLLESVAIGGAGAEQFNGLLWQAQQALATSQTVCYMEPLIASDTIVKLLQRLTVLKTALDAVTMRRWPSC